MRPLICHLRTDPRLVIHERRWGHNTTPDLRSDLKALPRMITGPEQLLEGLKEYFHGHQHSLFLGLLVDGLGGYVGAYFVGAYRV
jgi:hypothetical protein